MDSPLQHYLEQATHCCRMADSEKSPEVKAQWLGLAHRWLQMIPALTAESNVHQVDFGIGARQRA